MGSHGRIRAVSIVEKMDQLDAPFVSAVRHLVDKMKINILLKLQSVSQDHRSCARRCLRFVWRGAVRANIVTQ